MQTQILDVLRVLAGLAAGGVIGFGFGQLQEAALRQHTKLEKAGKLKTAWSLIPGSGGRVAYLLIALVLIQLICPLLFADGTQWMVSAGLLLGYGWMLLAKLRTRVRESKE